MKSIKIASFCRYNQFNHVVYELDYKVVIDNITIACEDLTKLGNIIVECRKIVVTHPSYEI